MTTSIVHKADTEIVQREATRELTVQDMINRKEKIGEVLRRVMREGEHYGKIPGCGDKPTLFKAGAEVLAMTFGLAPSFDVRRTDMLGGHREYEVTCTLSTLAGLALGQGIGSCSTMESKYRWRRGERVCPHCRKNAIIKGKAEYGGGWLCFAKRGGCGAKWTDGAKEIEQQETGRIENQDIADTYNTVLKMAKKRAQVDATLTAVGASDLLTQDLEDVQERHEAARPAEDVSDAEFTDHPNAPPRSNGNGKPSARQQAEPPQPLTHTLDDADLAADDIIAVIKGADTEAEIRSQVPKINALPKDTAVRARAKAAYLAGLERVRANGKQEGAVA